MDLDESLPDVTISGMLAADLLEAVLYARYRAPAWGAAHVELTQMHRALELEIAGAGERAA